MDGGAVTGTPIPQRNDCMKVGKVPENVLKRSVMKQLHYTRDEVLLGPGIGEDCAALRQPRMKFW